MHRLFSGKTINGQVFISIITLISLALITYANTFKAPFIFDDQLHITKNRHIRMTTLTVDSIMAVSNSPSGNRPLANLTFALNHYFDRYEVRGYHAINLLIHICTALLMFLIARQTLRLCGSDNILAPLLAAALWLVNPVHTQSVTFIVQRMNSLAAMFFLLAMFCYIRARLNAMSEKGRVQRFLLYGLCLLAAICGLASKPIAASLPVILFLYEWYFFQNLDRTWLKKQRLWIGPSLVIIAGLAFFYLGTAPVDKILSAYQAHDFTMAQRLWTEPGVVLYYICLLLFPYPDRLMLIYDFPVFSPAMTPLITLVTVLSLFALVTGGVLLSGKQRLLSFAIFWFLCNLLIESSVFGLALIYEHRTYLPSIFPFIALTAIIMKPSQTRTLPIAILGALIIICGLLTSQRNAVWSEDVRFWRDHVAKAPRVPTVNNNLGQVLLSNDQEEEAADYLKTAIKQAPDLESARVNLGVALQRLGQLPQAIAQYQTVLTANPENIDARFNLAMVLKKHGKANAAVDQFKKIIDVDPHNTSTMLKLGITLMETQKNRRALVWFKKAAALDSSDIRILNNLGIVLHRLGRIDQAITAYRQGLALAPGNPLLNNSLGLALMDSGRYEQATRHFKLALEADSELAEPYNNLALTAEKQGQVNQAIYYYQQALQRFPSYELARYNLSALFLETGQPDRATAMIQKIIAVKPEHWPALNRVVLALINDQRLGQATTLTMKMAAGAPDNPLIHYNLACLYARQNDKENAVNCLKKAVANGYNRWSHMKADPDLKNIQGTNYYKDLAQSHDW